MDSSPEAVWHLDLGLPSLQTVSYTFLLFTSHSVCGIFLQQTKWTKTVGLCSRGNGSCLWWWQCNDLLCRLECLCWLRCVCALQGRWQQEDQLGGYKTIEATTDGSLAWWMEKAGCIGQEMEENRFIIFRSKINKVFAKKSASVAQHSVWLQLM